MSLGKRSVKGTRHRFRIPFTSCYIGTSYLICFSAAFIGLIGFSHGFLIDMSIRHLPIHRIADHSEKECTSCKECHSIRKAHRSEDFGADHKEIVQQYPESCDKCHRQEFCSQCHKHYTGHPPKWITIHKVHPTSECITCHSKRFCSDCHKMSQHTAVDSRPITTAPTKINICSVSQNKVAPKARRHIHVKDNVSELSAANPPATIEKEKPLSHTDSWINLHGKTALADTSKCFACHTGTSCTSCHGVEIPHPEDWNMNHKDKGASFDADSNCFKCHNKEEFCGRCH